MAMVTWCFQYDKIIHDTDVRSTKMFHYENMPVQNTEIFKVVKNKNFQWKILIFFLILLKT